MKKITPYAKLSKKAKREQDRQKRGTWTINPVTRRPDPPAAYNRNAAKKELRRSKEYLGSFFSAQPQI